MITYGKCSDRTPQEMSAFNALSSCPAAFLLSVVSAQQERERERERARAKYEQHVLRKVIATI